MQPSAIKLASVSCVLLVVAFSSGGQAQDQFVAIPDPGKLSWTDTGPPFLNTQIAVVSGDPSKDGPFVMRFRCPDNYKIPAHTHPATEAVTVLEGVFNAGTGDKYDASKLTPVRRGGFFIMPGGMAHFGLCKGTTVIELHAQGPWGTEMLEKH